MHLICGSLGYVCRQAIDGVCGMEEGVSSGRREEEEKKRFGGCGRRMREM